MEQQLHKIDKFLKHQNCLFQIDPLDYPSLWQQQFITSYFTLNNIMNKQHSQIIRQLHSSTDKSLQAIAQDQKQFQKLITYMIVLRVQIWPLINQNYQILLLDYIDVIKPNCRLNFGILYNLLVQYNTPDAQLIRLLLKTINQLQKNNKKIQSSKKLLRTFIDILQKNQSRKNQQSFKIYHQQLFIKCLRLSSYTFYSEQCLQILEYLWNDNQQQCLEYCLDNMLILEMIPLSNNNNNRYTFIQNIYHSHKKFLQNHQEKYSQRERLYGVLLTRRIQAILQYILIVENIDTANIRIQLTWLQKQWEDRKQPQLLLLTDISVWISLSYDNINRRVYILDWAIRRTFNSDQNYYNIIRKSIFERWFRQIDNYQSYLVSIMILRQMIYNDYRIANDMLTFILQQQKQQNTDRIKQIFYFAHKYGYLKFEEIDRTEMINMGVKEAFRNLIGGYSTLMETENQMKPKQLEYNPIMGNRISSSNQQIDYDSPSISVPTKITSETQVLNIQQQFCFNMGTELTDLLDNPTIQNYNKFFKKICQLGVSSRKQQNNQQTTNMLCQQAAKTIYIMFNNEFQDFSTLINQEQSVIFKLLNYIVGEWHRVTHKLQIVKLIIKLMMELFPISEPAIWRYYFSYFQYGGAASNRNVKNWLVPTVKQDTVIPLLQCLMGKTDESLKKKLFKYGFKYVRPM